MLGFGSIGLFGISEGVGVGVFVFGVIDAAGLDEFGDEDVDDEFGINRFLAAAA